MRWLGLARAWRDAEGFFFHAGRTKDILKIAGHRVSPVEIEQAIARHPDVTDAAVVGDGHDIAGDVAAAFVVRRPGSALSDETLRRFCVEQLAPFKVPKTIIFGPLPRTSTGKVQKFVLRDRVKSVEAIV